MKVTIIPGDGVVGINGEFRRIAGLTAMFPNVHAVQWNGSAGHVEYDDGSQNEPMESLAEIQAAIDAWDAQTELAKTEPPKTDAELFSEAKIVRIKAIEAACQAAIYAPIDYMSTTFQADFDSQILIAQVIAACGGSLPIGFVWYDINNFPQPMTFADLQGLAGAILSRGQPLFARKQVRKAAIRVATSIAEVEAVTW